MKKIYLLLTLISTLFIYSQEKICGDDEEGKAIIYTQNKLNQSKFINNNENYVFKVKVHYISDTTGNQVIDEDLKEISTLDIIGVLNLYFNQQQIFFKYDGFDTIEDNDLFDYNYFNTSNDLFNHLTNQEYIDNNRIDLFISNSIINRNGSLVSGVCHKLKVNDVLTNEVLFINKDRIPEFSELVPSPEQLSNYTLIHEVGHYFGLYHTHQRWTNVNDELHKFSDTNQSCNYFEENLDGTEAYILEDFLSDTTPDRVKNIYDFSYDECFSINSDFANSHCSNTIDFNIFNPPMANIMAYYRYCREGFSGEQYYWMRAFIDDYSQSGNFLENAIFDVSVLYEPYLTDVIVISNDIISTRETTNGEIEVCRLKVVQLSHKFQKGFDYDFFHWQGDWNSPSDIFDYSEAVNELPNDLGILRSVRINQINSDIIPFERIACLRPAIICEIEPIANGVIASTPVIGSSNIIIKHLNSLEINSPNLINDLEIEKFHIINKTTISGAKFSKTIYKGN